MGWRSALVSMLLVACGGAPPSRGHVREADRGERVAIHAALGEGATLVDARAVGDPARVFAVYTRSGASPAPAACGAEPVPVDGAAIECASVVLARLSPALDAIDALVVIGVACASGDAPPVRIAQFEAGDLDSDGRVELAVEYDAVLTPANVTERVARVVDGETMAVELATTMALFDEGVAGVQFVFHPDEDPRSGLGVLDFQWIGHDEGEPLVARRPQRPILSVGLHLEPFDFGDVEPGGVRVLSYDPARDCWPGVP